MKPSPFLYVRPQTIAGVIQQLGRFGGEAKVLAGGQSLIPLLNLRMATPEALVDINGIDDLVGIDEAGGDVTIRAGTRQWDVERSALVEKKVPLLAKALKHVAHVQIRSMGTVGGSLAHADPAAELPAVAVALNARLDVAGPTGTRAVAAEDFFQDSFTTALEPDELLMAASFPGLDGRHTAFVEFARRTGDFAVAGVAAVVALDPEGLVSDSRLVACGVGPAPRRLTGAEAALVGRRIVPADAMKDVAAAAAAEVQPFSDIHADAGFRRALVGALVIRAVQERVDEPGVGPDGQRGGQPRGERRDGPPHRPGPPPARGLHQGRARAHRDRGGVRAWGVRRLHHPHERDPCSIVHRARGPGRGHLPDHGGGRHAARRAEPDATIVQRPSRLAVRLLHPGIHHDPRRSAPG